jgi:hypothetical protein
MISASFLVSLHIYSKILSKRVFESQEDGTSDNLHNVKLQYAAYHLQKPMDTIAQIIGAIRLYQRLIQTNTDYLSDNPIQPNIQLEYIPQKVSFKRLIEKGMVGDGVDVDILIKTMRSGFKIITAIYNDEQMEQVINMVDRIGSSENLVIFILNLSLFSQRYLKSRLAYSSIFKMPEKVGLGIDEVGPLVILLASCKKCLFIHPDSYIADINKFQLYDETVLFAAPTLGDNPETTLRTIAKFEPSAKAASIHKSVFIDDTERALPALLVAHAINRSKLCNNNPSNSWWMAFEVTRTNYSVLGKPVLAGLPAGDGLLCGVVASVDDHKSIIYAEHMHMYTRHLNITHIQPLPSIVKNSKTDCIKLDERKVHKLIY